LKNKNPHKLVSLFIKQYEENMLKVKICGITTLKQACQIEKLGADALGFIFYEKSPRYISPQDARKISKKLGPFIKKVGVFVNEDKWTVLEMLSYCNLDFAQLHGEETVEYCDYIGKEKVIKVFRIPANLKKEDFEYYLNKIKPYEKVVQAILIDTKKEKFYGGTGEETNWDFVKFLIENIKVSVILSGGIGLDNIERAKKIKNLYGVDANSKLEVKPGIKDLEKVERFILKAKCK